MLCGSTDPPALQCGPHEPGDVPVNIKSTNGGNNVTIVCLMRKQWLKLAQSIANQPGITYQLCDFLATHHAELRVNLHKQFGRMQPTECV
jgi:hypothetical protein